MSRSGDLLALSIVASLHLGCALTSKATPLVPRYFSPELLAPTPGSRAAEAPAAEPLTLRLGLVEAASHLEERISYRVHASELGYYEDRRWTERPEEFVRRALEQELFERRHLHRVVSGAGNTLDVELTAFEELSDPPARVRLALRFTLHDDRESSLERSLVVERALPPDGASEHAQRVASALGSALTEAVTNVSRDVVRALATAAAARAPMREAGDLARETSPTSGRSTGGSESQ